MAHRLAANAELPLPQSALVGVRDGAEVAQCGTFDGVLGAATPAPDRRGR